MNASSVLVMDVPTECECGCGTPVNERTTEWLRLRREGMKAKTIAEQYGVSRETVTAACRQPTRFVVGHAASREWVVRECAYCPNTFKIPQGASRDHCKRGDCPRSRLTPENIARNCAEFDAREAAKLVQKRTAFEGLIGVVLRAKRAAKKRRSKNYLTTQEAYTQQLRDLRGQAKDLGLHDELVTLIEEQERDDHRMRIGHGVRLDTDDDQLVGHVAAAVHFDREDDRWAYDAARRAKRKRRSQ